MRIGMLLGHTFCLLKVSLLGLAGLWAFLCLCEGQFGNIYWNFKCTYSWASNCILGFYSADKHGHRCKDSCRRPKQWKWPWIVDWWNKVWFIPIISYHMVTGGKCVNDIYVFNIMKHTRYGPECIVQTHLLREKKAVQR